MIPSIVKTHQPGLRAIRIDRPRLVRTIGLARRTGAVGPAAAGAFATELFALLHEAGWPGVRPSGLRAPGQRHDDQPLARPGPAAPRRRSIRPFDSSSGRPAERPRRPQNAPGAGVKPR